MATHPNERRIPIWPALLFLIWTLMGLAAFVMQSNADLTELAKTDAYQAKIWTEMPQWAWLSYGIAVGAGLASAIALLFRLKAAVWLSVVEIVAVIVQFSYTFLMTDLLAVRGWTTALFPLFILAIAILQLWYGLSLKRRGALR
jgi:hypothetical protein